MSSASSPSAVNSTTMVDIELVERVSNINGLQRAAKSKYYNINFGDMHAMFATMVFITTGVRALSEMVHKPLRVHWDRFCLSNARYGQVTQDGLERFVESYVDQWLAANMKHLPGHVKWSMRFGNINH
jgi:hypothetical protein